MTARILHKSWCILYLVKYIMVVSKYNCLYLGLVLPFGG
jgi:hypothetical protein